MKIKNLTCFILLFLIFHSALPAQTEDNLILKFEKELFDKNAKINSITCDFVQIRSISILTNDVVKKGKFYYLPTKNILLAFDDGDFIKMTETTFQMKNNNNVSEVKISSNPMLNGLQHLLTACMLGDIKQIARGFKLTVDQKDDTYIVTLVSEKKGSAAKLGKMTLVFDRKDMSLSLLKMEEFSGDYTQYEFTNKQFNGHIDPKLFEIR